MKKIKRHIVIILLMMILFILGASVGNDVEGAITGSVGVGWTDSLIGNFCCQKDTALWSTDIDSEYKKWYFKSLPYRGDERNRKY